MRRSSSIKSESERGMNLMERVVRWNDDRDMKACKLSLGQRRLYSSVASISREGKVRSLKIKLPLPGSQTREGIFEI